MMTLIRVSFLLLLFWLLTTTSATKTTTTTTSEPPASTTTIEMTTMTTSAVDRFLNENDKTTLGSKLIRVDENKIFWNCNDERSRALISVNFYYFANTSTNTTSANGNSVYSNEYAIYYKYLPCKSDCRFNRLTTLDDHSKNRTLKLFVDTYYEYVFLFTHRIRARIHETTNDDNVNVNSTHSINLSTSTSSSLSSSLPISAGAALLNSYEVERVLCSQSDQSTLKFSTCDQYQFSINVDDANECQLTLTKPTQFKFLRYIYSAVFIVVIVVVIVNIIRKIKFKYKIIKS